MLAVVDRAEFFQQMCAGSTAAIATLGMRFVRDATTILVHGDSRATCDILLAAAAAHRQFSVIVSEGRPDNTGCVLL